MKGFPRSIRGWWKANPAAKNVLVLLVFSGILAVLGLVAQLLLGNHLGPDRFGVLTFAVACGSFVTTFARYGRERIMLRDLVHFPDDFARIVVSTLLLETGLLTLLMAGFFVLGYLAPDRFPGPLLLIVLAVGLMALDLQQVFDYRRRMGRHAFYTMLQKAVYLLILLVGIAVFPGHFGLYWVAVAMLLGNIVGLVPQFYEVLPTLTLRSFARDDVGDTLNNTTDDTGGGTVVEILRDALPETERRLRNNMSMALLSLLDLVVGPAVVSAITFLHGETTTGLYGVAFLFLTAANLVWQQVLRAATPTINEIVRPGTTVSRRVGFCAKYLVAATACILPFAIPMIACPEFLLGLLFRPAYAPAAAALPVFGLTLLLSPVTSLGQNLLVAMRRDRLFFWSNVFAALAGLAAIVRFVPGDGIRGAAWVPFTITLVVGILQTAIIATIIHSARRKGVKENG